MHTRRLFFLLLVSVVALPLVNAQPAQAADSIEVEDQANVVPVSLFNSIKPYNPLGQSFTPMLPGLDVVELWIVDPLWFNGDGVELYLNIRESTIYGPILGTSDILQAENIRGATRFSFPTLVPLKTGNVYVIEVVDIGVESTAIGSLGGPDSTYPGGTWILKGEEITGNDFWFREGLANSTPQTPAYCKNDLWAYLSRPDGSSYKNQGDCLQYLFTSK